MFHALFQRQLFGRSKIAGYADIANPTHCDACEQEGFDNVVTVALTPLLGDDYFDGHLLCAVCRHCRTMQVSIEST